MSVFKISGYKHTPPTKTRKGSMSGAQLADAVDIETACHAVNRINAKRRHERATAKQADKNLKMAIVNPALDAWLKKEVP